MKRLLSVWLAVGILLSQTACGGATPSTQHQKFTTTSFDYFDTVTSITGYEPDRQSFDRVAQTLLEQLGEYHRLFDIYLRYEGINNLCTVNQIVDGVHPTVPVDQKIIDLLLYAREVYDQTQGMVNVAMGSVLRLWHDCRKAGANNPAAATLPSATALAEAARHTDIRNLMVDRENRTVHLADPHMRLDVGAIAKGYAVEQVARWLEQQGKTGYVLNVGGNVRAVGAKPDGSGWLAGLENPQDPSGAYLATLSLTNQALVTSGSYQRYYTVNGKRYHHIIHPDTQMPAQGLLSVSVVCSDSGQGDALSTALFCMPVDRGKALVESLPGVEALWVAEGGEQTPSSGWHKYVYEGA